MESDANTPANQGNPGKGANESTGVMRQTLSGPLLALDLGGGRWRLTNSREPADELFLSGVRELSGAREPHAVLAVAASLAQCSELEIEWAADGAGVLLTLRCGSQTFTFGASTALLHQPRQRLYDTLPLPGYTPDAQRFWRRVFRLVRLPGGRFFLTWLARRARGR